MARCCLHLWWFFFIYTFQGLLVVVWGWGSPFFNCASAQTIRNVCLLLLGIKKTHPFQRARRSITVNCVIRAAPVIIANSWHAAHAELSCVSIRSWKWHCWVQYYGVALCWDIFCKYSLIKVVLLHPILWCWVVLGMKTELLRTMFVHYGRCNTHSANLQWSLPKSCTGLGNH